jgi:hypothetical protein
VAFTQEIIYLKFRHLRIPIQGLIETGVSSKDSVRGAGHYRAAGLLAKSEIKQRNSSTWQRGTGQRWQPADIKVDSRPLPSRYQADTKS